MKQNLNEFLASVNAHAYTPDKSLAGCFIITNTVNSRRFRLSKTFRDALNSPIAIELYFTEDSVLVILTDGTSKCSITFRSGGYVYDSCLTEKLIEMSGVEVPEGKSRKIGIFTTNQLEDGSIYAEVKFN